MTRYSLRPTRLFDRRWRPGHPFRPKTCRARKLVMAALLAVLCLIIGGYAYLTDSDRVRAMAESYLSGLVGGRVTVGNATLSIFEGLRLDFVRVYVPDVADDDAGPGTRPASAPARRAEGASASNGDSEIFFARSFVISYDPRSMLRGELQATQIIAEKPSVRLTHDVRTGTWNFARLRRHGQDRPQPQSHKPGRPPTQLPELLLRNARVEVAEVRGGERTALGHVAIDGRLTPTAPADAGGAPQTLDFVLQSRGDTDAMGPLASGSVDLATGHVTAQLGQFEFGHDVRSLLLSEPREWTDRHGLSGKVNIPFVEYIPAGVAGVASAAEDGIAGTSDKPRFTIRMVLQRVDLAIPLEEQTSPSEAAGRAAVSDALSVMRRAYRIAGSDPTATLAALADPPPVRLRDVAGTFEFTQDGISVRQANGCLEGNRFQVNGHIDGYSPDAAVALNVASAEGETLEIPASPAYVWSLPRDLKEVYDLLHPQGACRVSVDVTRPAAGAAVQTTGRVEILDGHFVCKEFPYPLRDVAGVVTFGRNLPGKTDGRDWVRLEKIRGKGVPDGANRDATLEVSGWVGPVGPGLPEPCLDLTIHSENIHSEPALSKAYLPEIRQALSIFDAAGTGHLPQFRGAFTTHLFRKEGGHQKITFDTDIHLADAEAALVGFPYPVKGLTADLRVRDGYVDVVNAEIRRGSMSAKVSGRVSWATDDRPGGPGPTRLTVTVRNLPVDEALLGALPGDCAGWVRKMGVQALLDVDGTLTASRFDLTPAAPSNPAPAASPAGPAPPATAPTQPSTPALNYDFAIRLHDGSVRPRNGALVISDVAGALHLTRERLDLLELHGKRGKATLTARGGVTWPGDTPLIAFSASAKELLLEPALYALLPEAARKAWDELQPAGTLDADLSYANDANAGRPGQTVRIDLTRGNPAPPTTRPVVADIPPGFRATLRPRELSARMRTIPYALEHVLGEVEVRPDKVTLTGVSARHGKAAFTLSGTGALEPAPAWNLKVTGKDVEADADLRRALPAAVASVFDALKLKGRLGFTLDRLTYRPPAMPPTAAPTAAPAAAADPEVDLHGALMFDGAGLDVGVPVTEVTGGLGFGAAIRRGRLHSLDGALDIASLRMADRWVTDFKTPVVKPADRPELQLSQLRGEVAGGDLAGQVLLAFPDDGPSRYGLSLVVRNADVRELAGETDQNLSGRLTASLALEGQWDKADARRGRGDVVVSGKDMYHIPLVLGMLQVTNLALPVSSPFKGGVARYSVEGQKVTFEKIELRSDNMLMSGDGTLDFATKRVRMNFVTDNPGGFQIPFVQDLWRGAQHELLRIQVRGSVQAPQVHASSMGTLWTTVDEVFRGDNPEEHKGSRSRRRHDGDTGR